jgi:hypothetical protein
MLRRFAGCLVLFAFILQGVAQASADLSVASRTTQHCDGHAIKTDDCFCCAQGCHSADDCAELCALAAAPPTASPALEFDPLTGYQPAAASEPPGPSYAPLKPPPKS